MRCSLKTLGPVLSASRMVREYTESMYEPSAAQAEALSESKHERARELAAWKRHVAGEWPKVSVVSVDGGSDTLADLGAPRPVSVVVDLGGLQPSDVAVQLVHGPVAVNDDLSESSVVTLSLAVDAGPSAGGTRHLYQGSFECERPGRYGFTVRVVPNHRDLVSQTELGLITWS
jgi:starch phosphorylase